jgi:hypothetical protein
MPRGQLWPRTNRARNLKEMAPHFHSLSMHIVLLGHKQPYSVEATALGPPLAHVVIILSSDRRDSFETNPRRRRPGS